MTEVEYTEGQIEKCEKNFSLACDRKDGYMAKFWANAAIGFMWRLLKIKEKLSLEETGACNG